MFVSMSSSLHVLVHGPVAGQLWLGDSGQFEVEVVDGQRDDDDEAQDETQDRSLIRKDTSWVFGSTAVTVSTLLRFKVSPSRASEIGRQNSAQTVPIFNPCFSYKG